MRTVIALDPDLNRVFAGWLALQLDYSAAVREPYRTMGVFDDDALRAVVLFENYQQKYGTVEISGAATTPKWLTLRVLRAIADFSFGDLDCQLVVMRCDAEDDGLKRFLTGAGFDRVVIPRMRGRDKDEAVYTLTDDAWNKGRLATRIKRG